VRHEMPVMLPLSQRPATIPHCGTRRRKRVQTGRQTGHQLPTHRFETNKKRELLIEATKAHHTIPDYKLHRVLPPAIIGPKINTSLDLLCAGTTQFPRAPAVNLAESSHQLVMNEKLCRKQAKTALGKSCSAWDNIPSNFKVEMTVQRMRHLESLNVDVDTNTRDWEDGAIDIAVGQLTQKPAHQGGSVFETATMQFGRGSFMERDLMK